MRLAAISRTLAAYGRPARILSCALRILDAATISMALVIFRVFCTLLILVRISLIPAIALPVRALSRAGAKAGPHYVWTTGARARGVLANHLKSTVLLEIFNGSGELGLVFLGQFLLVFDTLHQGFVLGLEGIFQRLLERQDLVDFEVVEVALGNAEQRDGQFPDLQRLVLRLLEQFDH